MGDRVSIQFKNGERLSVALFSHWGGKGFVTQARNYAKKLAEEALEAGETMPLYRLEPSTTMVDFIRHTTKKDGRVEHDLYLGKDENDGDNGDNGNFIIDLEKALKDAKAKK